MDKNIYEEVLNVSLEYFKFNPPTVESVEQPEGIHSSLFSDTSILTGFGICEDDNGTSIRAFLSKRQKMQVKHPTIEGYPVMPVYIGKDVLASSFYTPSAKIHYNNGKVCCGGSVGAVDDMSRASFAGTLGAIVEKDGKRFGLSNNHVFAGFNFYPKQKPFFMPSPMDMLPSASSKSMTIGRLHEACPLYFGLNDFHAFNEMDAALISLDDDSIVSSMQGRYYDTPVNVADPVTQMAVKKVGRTTEL